MTALGAIAAWTSPVLAVAVVARVTAGGVEAPLFVLAVLAAPLLALLAGPDRRQPRSGFALTITLAVVVCVLGAGFRALADLGQALGLETGATLGTSATLVLVTTLWPDQHRVAATALALGAAALVLASVTLGATVSSAPWTAWSRVASRGAFELGPQSEWTREGARFSRPVALTFAEPHRITAATAAVVRVTERDRTTTVRDHRLGAGESLTLRPGDTLAIPPGVRVRFEPGRRVPAGPASGVAWADGGSTTRPGLLLSWIGVILTLTGGALSVVRPSASSSPVGAWVAPATVLGVFLAAACWGVYVVDVAPELAIDGLAVALLTHLALVVADEPWRSRLLIAVVVALVALFIGSAAGLRRCLREQTVDDPAARRPVLEPALWIAVVAAAAAAGVMVTDAWGLFWWGAGLAAATLLGPLVATAGAPGDDRARASGAVAGTLVFVALSALARWPGVNGGLAALIQAPALAAAPAAWLIARLLRSSEV